MFIMGSKTGTRTVCGVLHFWQHCLALKVSLIKFFNALELNIGQRMGCVSRVGCINGSCVFTLDSLLCFAISNYKNHDRYIICSSTMFLMGPLKQVKRMCDKTRALATAIMIVRVHAHTHIHTRLLSVGK